MDEKKKTIKLSKLAITLIILVIACSIALPITYSWVSKNRSVEDDVITFSLNADLMGDFTNTGSFVAITGQDDEEITTKPSSNFLPGTTSDFQIGMYNKSDETVVINTFGLEAPSVWVNGESGAYDKSSRDFDENPVYLDGRYYYFGQNMDISVSKYTIYDAEVITNEDKEYLRLISTLKTVNLTPVEQRVLTTISTTQNRLVLVDVSSLEAADPTGDYEILLNPGDAILFNVDIEFINQSGVDQSMFMGFGTTTVGGYCHRCIYATFNHEGL